MNGARSLYYEGVTPPEIALFIGRLMRRELAQGELSALTTRDLDAINHYLIERAKARSARQRPANRPPRDKVHATGAQRTYTEQEILAEFAPD